ncbi:hypothetical protein NVP1121O_205 [Vibrio phage 1.121.O._10N.286.46.C4]|nr:hypothetical protein NVP1121O_205 [Vibrio phage 1.121.O._10N.286.46.C4]
MNPKVLLKSLKRKWKQMNCDHKLTSRTWYDKDSGMHRYHCEHCDKHGHFSRR